MPILDFCEIPEAHKNSGKQDSFELFARDFLEYLGYKIVQGPDRGADGGKDLIVEEIRKGVGGKTVVKWLVSCKHKAHSGSSVGSSDEIDIVDRVRANSCMGFIAFYSTLPSSGLTKKLEGLRLQGIEYQIYDYEQIEKKLLGSLEGVEIAERYFPNSIRIWKNENPKPEKFFWKYPDIVCEYCGKNLLEPNPSGIIVIFEQKKDEENDEIIDIYYSCKGYCDDILQKRYRLKYQNAFDGWEDISDICIPTIYLKWMNSIFHDLQSKDKYSKHAFEKMQNIMNAIFPYISRKLTKEEKEIVESLEKIPSWLGGLGYEVE
jgi:hypothetical protein